MAKGVALAIQISIRCVIKIENILTIYYHYVWRVKTERDCALKLNVRVIVKLKKKWTAVRHQSQPLRTRDTRIEEKLSDS